LITKRKPPNFLKAFLFVVILYLQQSQLNHFSLHSLFTYTSKEIIGRRIKFLRKQNNMTLQQLADLINADRQYIWNIENGDVNLTLDYLDKILDKLGCKHEDFFNISDIKEN